MFTKRSVKLAALFVVLLTGGYFFVERMVRAQRPEGQKITDAREFNRLISGRDFSESPPRIEDFNIRLLDPPIPEGNAVLNIRFAPEESVPNRIAITIDGNVVILNDDGKGGDDQVRDGVHSAVARVDIAALQQDRIRIAGIQADWVPVFRGREFVTVKKIDRRVVAFQPGINFDIFPVGNPGNVDAGRSLMITDVNVVQDPDRTRTECTGGSSMGKWSFGYLMQEMSNVKPFSGNTAEGFVKRWLERWKKTQTVNDFDSAARFDGIIQVIDSWPKLGDGVSPDLSKAPFRLLAIVSRLDLRSNFAYGGGGGSGGELRFVFGYVNPQTCAPTPFTVIFEYGVKVTGCDDLKNWAKKWIDLKLLAPGSPEYNNALEAITEQIVKRNADPGKTNGSALNQLRTNELTLDFPWELREFRLSSLTDGNLEQVTVKQTPDISFNDTSTLGNFINMNQSLVIKDRHKVPLNFGPTLEPFLGADAPITDIAFRWFGQNIANPEARFHFSLNTCNGCHAGETDTFFTHLRTLQFGGGTQVLSKFLTGSTATTIDDEYFPVADPFNSPVVHKFNDLRRRATDLDLIANSPCILHIASTPISADLH